VWFVLKQTDKEEESGDMTSGLHAVAVRQFPDELSIKQKFTFLHEISSVMSVNRPRLVIDCSTLGECNTPSAIHLLLHCLEEAMKRNGDVKLAAVPPAAAVVLVSTGVARLFETFDTTAEAVKSFHQLPRNMPVAVREPHRESKEAA
jgi:anti-anti-sigma regulatory factor